MWGFVDIGTQPHHLFTHCHGCLPARTAELSSWDRDHMAYKAKNISYQALCKKSLLTLPYQGLRLVLEAVTGGLHTFQDPLSCEAETMSSTPLWPQLLAAWCT